MNVISCPFLLLLVSLDLPSVHLRARLRRFLDKKDGEPKLPNTEATEAISLI